MSHATDSLHIAVIGAGWAGLAATATLQELGCRVTVFEAAHQAGGRARRLPSSTGFDHPLDNGQHILLGAYRETLALMQSIGINPDKALLRLPLQLGSADGSFGLRAPRWPAPWHALAALLEADGLNWSERLAAIRLLLTLKGAHWQAPAQETVAGLLQRLRQPERLCQRLWHPLCMAAMNTLPAEASAALFATVLRDSLGGSRHDSDLLLPARDLSALWPDTIAQSADIRFGHTIRKVHLELAHGLRLDQFPTIFDGVIAAIPPHNAHRLLHDCGDHALLARLNAFDTQPIATLYFKLAKPWKLPAPMLMLWEDHERGHDGQWLFDRTQLLRTSSSSNKTADSGTELAVVVSAAQALLDRPRELAIARLEEQVREQIARHPRNPGPMPEVIEHALMIEKKATFTARPGLVRPATATHWPGLRLAGDWTDTGYPGVLEGAVRSGKQAAQELHAWLNGVKA